MRGLPVVLLVFLSLVGFWFSIPVFAAGGAQSGAPEITFDEALDHLDRQMSKLERLKPRKCADEYRTLFAGPAINVALYYGYGEYQNVTVDPVHAAAMAEYLQMARCQPSTVLCEFQLVQRTPEMTVLRKMIAGKPVTLRIYSTSVSTVHSVNMGAKEELQDQRSERVRANFHRDLTRSDIVFYTGHARFGGGFGFNPQSPLQAVWENLSRLNLADMVDALSVRPSLLKVFGVFGCKTDELYRESILRANPRTDLILTRTDIDSSEAEQLALGALNAILGQKCQPDVRASMVSASWPNPQAIRYIKRVR